MFIEPTMSTCLQAILSEICQKMSAIPVVMCRVPHESRKEFLPSVAFLLNQLQIIVSNINNGSNNNSDLNNNFTWDNSHDFPVYDDCDSSIDLDQILCAGDEGGQETLQGY